MQKKYKKYLIEQTQYERVLSSHSIHESLANYVIYASNNGSFMQLSDCLIDIALKVHTMKYP